MEQRISWRILLTTDYYDYDYYCGVKVRGNNVRKVMIILLIHRILVRWPDDEEVHKEESKEDE